MVRIAKRTSIGSRGFGKAVKESLQKAMRRRGSREPGAIEVAFQREHDAMGVGIVAGTGDPASVALALDRVSRLRQPTSQAATGRVAYQHFLDQLRRLDSLLTEVDDCLSVAV